MTIQRDLVAQPWPDDAPVQVRIGLHVGEVVEHGADLIGLAVHQAARVATTAHGGQIVVSDDLRSAVGPLAADITLRSLGEYRVRDLGVTELHQVCASGLAEVHPPLRAVTVRRTNLGPSATVLVGRGDNDA